MKSEVTDAMRDKFRKGEYIFSPPPVPTLMWTLDDWCRYVTFTKGKDNGNKKKSTKEETPQH